MGWMFVNALLTTCYDFAKCGKFHGFFGWIFLRKLKLRPEACSPESIRGSGLPFKLKGKVASACKMQGFEN
jgi:hypothetical protein